MRPLLGFWSLCAQFAHWSFQPIFSTNLQKIYEKKTRFLTLTTATLRYFNCTQNGFLFLIKLANHYTYHRKKGLKNGSKVVKNEFFTNYVELGGQILGDFWSFLGIF